jgi:hypothetical protein
VELRDARFGDAQHLADLPQGELLVVVERDDQLLPLRQGSDRLADQLLQLGRLHLRPRLGSVLILDRVDECDCVA